MFDLHQSISDENGEHDDSKVGAYIEGLTAEFAASPEAKPFLDSGAGVDWSAMMMEYALNYTGVTPPNMTLADFEEVVFELIPRKVSTEAESAPEIVEQLRAFWQFLERQYGLHNARQILGTLGPSAEQRLRKELDNPSNFGMAKSFVMLGQQAGFDMTTQEGIDQFMLAFNSRLLTRLGPAPLLPSASDPAFASLLGGGLSAEERAAKRKARKKQRQARKRNRR